MGGGKNFWPLNSRSLKQSTGGQRSHCGISESKGQVFTVQPRKVPLKNKDSEFSLIIFEKKSEIYISADLFYV